MTHRPSRPLKLALCLGLGLAATSCWQPATAPTAPTALQVTVPGEGTVTAVVRLAPVDAEGRRLLTAVTPWKKADIDHALVELYEGGAATPIASRRVEKTQLDATLSFNNLKANTAYRLVTRAWSDAGEQSRIDDAAANPASCTTAFATTAAPRLEVDAIKLKLKDWIIAGQAAGAIGITEGVPAGSLAAESAVLIPPPTAGTYAGGEQGYVDGPIAGARFSEPRGVAVDPQGNLYVADTGNNRIRKISREGVVSTLAGDGELGFVDGPGEYARFDEPFGIAVDAQGNVFVADNNCIRKVTPAGVVSTLAGNGENGFADGTGAEARFDYPAGMTADALGNVYVADQSNNAIRKMTPDGVVTTVAGDGEYDEDDGPAASASFRLPMGVAIDRQGNLYVGDRTNERIRKISPAGIVSTLAGDGVTGFVDGPGASARFNYPYGVTVDPEGNVYVGDAKNNAIRKISPAGVVSTFAGGTQGFAEGIGSAAMFYGPRGMASDARGNIYVADTYNHRIRKVR